MQEYITKILGSGCRHSSSFTSSSAQKTTTLIISNDKMKALIEIVKSLEDSGLSLKGISERIQNEAKEPKEGFLSTLGTWYLLLGTLGVSLSGNILGGKGINRAGEGAIVKSISEETKSKRQGLGIVRAGYANKKVQKTTTKNKNNFYAASSFN